MLWEDNSGEGIVPQDKQDLACYLAPCADALEVLPGAEYRATSKHRVGAVPWWKQGSTRLQVFMKSLWYGAGSTLGLSQGSTRVRTPSTILLAIWDLLLVGMWLAVLGSHECATYAQDLFCKADASTIYRIHRERVVAGTTRDGVPHTSRKGLTSELVLGAIGITERYEKAVAERTFCGSHNSQIRLMLTRYYGGCYG